jgi:hypothetical protein
MPFLRLLLFILVPIVFVAVPTSYIEAGHSICLVKNLFGVECPGCGMTRALSAFMHGNVVSAIRFNKSIVIIGPLLSFTLIRAFLMECNSFYNSYVRLVPCRKSLGKYHS